MSRDDHPSVKDVNDWMASADGVAYVEAAQLACEAFANYDWACKPPGMTMSMVGATRHAPAVFTALPVGYYGEPKTSSFSDLTDEEREALHRRETGGD